MPKWTDRLAKSVAESTTYAHLRAFVQANADSVRRILRTSKGGRARAIVNISSAYVPNFCHRTTAGLYPAYLNSYDLGKASARAGSLAPSKHWTRREIVDHALAGIHAKPMDQMYFAAADLDGTGIRFYGDMTLVLESTAVDPSTLVLDRNSWDVMLPPYSGLVNSLPTPGKKQYMRRLILRWLSGRWGADLPLIGATKVLAVSGPRNRRLTTGQVSHALLEDEDYVEVVRHASFDARDIEVSRVSVADITLEADIERRMASKTPPNHIEGLWLLQRRDAESALARVGVGRRVVTSSGRVRP